MLLEGIELVHEPRQIKCSGAEYRLILILYQILINGGPFPIFHARFGPLCYTQISTSDSALYSKPSLPRIRTLMSGWQQQGGWKSGDFSKMRSWARYSDYAPLSFCSQSTRL
jgi:hypothetical protein